MNKKKKTKAEQQYSEMTKAASPNSPCVMNCLKAFLFGGTICLIGQGLRDLYALRIPDDKTVGTLVSVTLIAIAVILTGFGVFDKIAKHAGAGTLVPITGFANAVVSPALEFSTDERDIIGLSRKAP